MPSTDHVEYPLAEGARLLGLSTEATRKRIQRKTLQGSKRAGQWYVLLPSGLAGPRPDEAAGRQDKTAGQPDDSTGQQADAGLLSHLQGEVEFLRAEVKRKDEMLWLKDQTIAELTTRLPRLPAPGETSASSKSWWQRLFGAE